jgi:DNA-binding MarR family transcriptional regulator
MSTSCYCIALRKASRKVSSLYDDALKDFGITVAQFSLLRKLQTKQPQTITELAERMSLDRSTVGRNIKLLEAKDLIETMPGDDLREAPLNLSEKGNALLFDCAPKWQRVQDDLEARLGSQGIRQLTELLSKL